ncbi:MAG: protein kinase, partial [Curtobacterium sp.]
MPVFDLVEEEAEHWLVMEYVPGSTLAGLIRDQGALAPDQAATILAQAADGLAAAHAAGIVHRDVKPSNILVTTDAQVKIFNGTGTKEFRAVTNRLVSLQSPQNQFAIVLDGSVIEAPQTNSAITNGKAQITGSFTAESAKTL